MSFPFCLSALPNFTKTNCQITAKLCPSFKLYINKDENGTLSPKEFHKLLSKLKKKDSDSDGWELTSDIADMCYNMALAGAGSNDATKELTYSALQLFVFGDKKDTTEAISNISADIASWGRDSSIVVAAQPSTPHQVGARMDGAVLPATLTPAVQVQAMATMQVTVPQGAVSGQPIVVQTQSGMHMQVIIPPRLLPGQTFLIQLPPPVQSTVAPTPGVVVQGALVQSVTKWECMMCKTLTDNSNCPRCFADKFGKGLKSKMCTTTRVNHGKLWKCTHGISLNFAKIVHVMTLHDEFCTICGRDRSGQHKSWVCTALNCNTKNLPNAVQCCQCGQFQEEKWICVCDQWNPASLDLCVNCSRHRETGDWVCMKNDCHHVNIYNESEKKQIQCRKCNSFLPGRWHCRCSKWHEDGYKHGIWCACGFDPENKVSFVFCVLFYV